MILSLNGTLSIFAAYANLLTIATFLGIGVNTTKKYANHPLVKILLLYVFAYSVINDKLACLFAVALFTVVEVREFVSDAKDELIAADADLSPALLPKWSESESESIASGDTQKEGSDNESDENLL